jgi:hypothetical protein
VITSSGFTPSAQRLSATTGVVLLLHSEVDRFVVLAESAADLAVRSEEVVHPV